VRSALATEKMGEHMNLTPQQYGLHAEKEVKKILEQEFNATFTKRKLVLGKKSNGEENKHEFDLVSDDNKIVVEIKSYKFDNKTTKKAGYATTRKWRLIGAYFYLSKVKKATKRILVLTNKELFSEFNKDMDGLLNSNVEIRHIPFEA
jgi:hypothetical protein